MQTAAVFKGSGAGELWLTAFGVDLTIWQQDGTEGEWEMFTSLLPPVHACHLWTLEGVIQQVRARAGESEMGALCCALLVVGEQVGFAPH